MLRADAAHVAEMRTRLLAGLKRYFVAKRLAGLLSINGLRILHYACDKAAEEARHPLQLWSSLEKEIRGGWATWLASRTSLAAARGYRRLPAPLQRFLSWPFKKFTGLFRRFLGRKMLVACEVAVEYYLSLLWSPQVQLLKGHAEGCWQLLEEVEEEAEAAHKFIIERGEGGQGDASGRK